MSTTRRYHGLDLVRLTSFVAICIFHISFIHYSTPSIEIASQSAVFTAMEYFARTLAFSGFTVCVLTSVLTAYSGKGLAKRFRLFAFLMFGWCVFSALIDAGDVFLMWAIYPLILVGILTATLAEMSSPRLSRMLGLLGAVMLWIPFWQLGEIVHMPRDVKAVLGFGNCQLDQVEWPILPWIGLVWLGYLGGQSLREVHVRRRESRLRLGLPEGLAWGVVLAASWPLLGGFYRINLGQFFACEAYRQPPLIWWAHLAWPLFAMRLAVEPRIAGWLAERRFCRAASNLAVSRKFWIAYIASYLLAHALSIIGTATGLEQTEWRVPATVAFAIAYFPLIELTTRLVMLVARQSSVGFARIAEPAREH
jgi:hypothetical protein